MAVDRRTILTGATAGLAGLAVTTPSAEATRQRRYDGKVVLITGATFGIGRAAAKAFAAAGARVGFCGRTESAGREVEREIRRSGGNALYVKADVRVPEQVKSFVDQVASRFGRLDVAVNNAGIHLGKPLHETTVEDWDNVQFTNARGVFLSIKYEVPHLIRAGGGVIICTASSQAEQSRPGHTAYTASKRAIQGIVKAAALDYGASNIRVVAIDPGTTDTRLVRPPGVPDQAWEEFKKAWGPLNVHALRRMAQPEEIASAMVAFAGSEFSYLTGESILVDGGRHAGGPMIMPPGFPPPA